MSPGSKQGREDDNIEHEVRYRDSGCGGGHTFDERGNAVKSDKCDVALSWARHMTDTLEWRRQLTGGTGVAVHVWSKNAVGPGYFARCVSSRVPPGPGIVLLEVSLSRIRAATYGVEIRTVPKLYRKHHMQKSCTTVSTRCSSTWNSSAFLLCLISFQVAASLWGGESELAGLVQAIRAAAPLKVAEPYQTHRDTVSQTRAHKHASARMHGQA